MYVYQKFTKKRFDNHLAKQCAKEMSLKEGLEKGKKEGKEETWVEMARSMLEDGLAPERVDKITGLMVEEVKKLKTANKHKNN